MSIQSITAPQNHPVSLVESDIFNAYPNAEVWLGIAGDESGVFLPRIYTAARILRANKYIEKGFLSEDKRQADGGEMDADDWRSTHIVALEPKQSGVVEVVGNIRSILKRTEDDLLPIEHHFPDAFLEEPAPVGSVEASRFIENHAEKSRGSAISLALMRAVNAQSYEKARQPVYAIVEAGLKRRFGIVGLPLELIAEPRPLAEYGNTVNMAVKFNPKEIMDAVDSDINSAKLITSFFKSARQNSGLGYYDRSLVEPLELPQ